LTRTEVEMFFPIIKTLRDSGITVIYISHKLEEVFRICDRVTILRDGCVVGESAVANITRREIIEKMVGRPIDMEYPHRTAEPAETVLEVRHLSRGRKLHDIGFELNASSFSGSIRSDLPLTLGATRPGNERRRPGPMQHATRGVFGDGSATLTIRTFSGDVVITKR
jgi:ABC-type sugar transport system ATPase subunit